MTTPAHNIRYGWADYLALESSSNVKHEYLDGQIYGMPGGTPEHAALKAVITGLLFGQLRNGRCRLHDADLRVRVPETGLATYPDVTVVWGPLERHSEDRDAVTNPVEVWSRGDANQWTQTIVRAGERALLTSIAAELVVSEVYASAEEPRV